MTEESSTDSNSLNNQNKSLSIASLIPSEAQKERIQKNIRDLKLHYFTEGIGYPWIDLRGITFLDSRGRIQMRFRAANYLDNAITLPFRSIDAGPDVQKEYEINNVDYDEAHEKIQAGLESTFNQKLFNFLSVINRIASNNFYRFKNNQRHYKPYPVFFYIAIREVIDSNYSWDRINLILEKYRDKDLFLEDELGFSEKLFNSVEYLYSGEQMLDFFNRIHGLQLEELLIKKDEFISETFLTSKDLAYKYLTKYEMPIGSAKKGKINTISVDHTINEDWLKNLIMVNNHNEPAQALADL